jgi:uncharacterized protein YbjT (DUF2867 family)
MILVCGATGNVGSAVVDALVAAGQPVRAVVRRAGAEPTGAEAVIGDLNAPETFVNGLNGVDGLFMLSGYSNEDKLLEAARAAGVRHVVLLSSGSLDGTATDNAVAAYHQASEDAVRASGMTYTFLRPTSFMSNALRWRDQLRDGNVVRAQWPDIAIATIDPRDIADVAVHALTTDSGNATYRLTGPEALTPSQQVAVLASAIGRPLEFYGLTPEETRAELDATMPPAYANAFWSFFGEGTVDETTVHDTVPQVLGRPARTFAQWCTDHAAAFAA